MNSSSGVVRISSGLSASGRRIGAGLVFGFVHGALAAKAARQRRGYSRCRIGPPTVWLNAKAANLHISQFLHPLSDCGGALLRAEQPADLPMQSVRLDPGGPVVDESHSDRMTTAGHWQADRRVERPAGERLPSAA